MSIQNVLSNIEKRKKENKPSLLKRGQEFLAPPRGYTDVQLAETKPTLKEVGTGTAKAVGEIGLGLAAIGRYGLSKVPKFGERYKTEESKKQFEGYVKKTEPKTAGEAGVMRRFDIATLGSAGIVKNVGRETLERIAKETDPIKIATLVKDNIPQLANPDILKRITPGLTETRDVNQVQRMIDVAIKSQPKQNEGKLLSVHNLSEQKLRFADRVGGLANPSLAVIDPKLTGFESYGDISLIGDKNLIEGQKTHLADAYSPRFPSVHSTMSYKDYENLTKEIEPYYKEIGENVRRFQHDDMNMISNIENNPAVALKFLKENGIKPTKEGQYYYHSQIRNSGLENKYQTFLDNLYKKYNLKEQMFAGYTNTGKRRYKPVSVEEASKIMGKQKEEGFNYGLGSYRSKIAPIKRNAASIRKEAGRLVTKEQFELVKEAYDKELWDLKDKLQPYAKNIDSNSFIESDRQLDTIGAVLSGEKDAMYYFKNKYPDIPTKLINDVYAFRDKLKNMPTEYFETKFRRPVDIGEFKIAVVPDTITQEAKAILEKKGLRIIEYAKGKKQEVMQSLLKQQEAFGVGAGIQQDEQGNYTFNPTAAALGVAGIHGVKRLSKADQLIAEGKIRVVSRDGRDVYQVKKGDEWVNKRDEDSAVKHFEPKPKPVVAEVAPELNEKLMGLMVQKEMLDLMPEKKLAKYAAKTGEEKGTLREVTGEGGTFASKGDDIVNELGFEDSEAAREAYVKYQNRVADVAADIQNTKDAIKSAKQRAREQREIEKMQSDLVDAQVPAFAKTRAEVKSLEESASKLLDELVLPPTKMPLSLEEIVTQTPLKAKVNLLDYIRTPEKVLKKIGFWEEAKLLRKKYDDYVVELPKNIDKISKWVDKVPKDANERIFQYLDGKEVQLYGNEQKIAEEIREYLKEWAVRLKLPEDKRITNYITHLFDEELIAKEFDEDLAKIIAEKIPGEVYDPFLQKRLGAQGYIQDVWKALDAYTKRATRKVHIDEALQKIQDKAGSSLEFSNIEKSQFEYIKNYVDRVNMRPTRIDELLDTGIKQITGYKLGQRPINRISGLMRRVTYRGMLGANLGSALRNLSQGVNTYAVLGERDFALGYMKLFSEKARNEMVEQGLFNNTFIQDRSLSATKKAMEKADKALWFFFDAAEKINRGAAYMGAKTKGLRKGMSEEEAIDYAKSIVRKTQFNYDSVDTPVALSSDLVKTLAQFQTYTVKQTEFLAGLAADRNFGALARYVVGGLAFVYTIGQAFGMEEKELAPMFRFDGPPSLKFPIELAKAAFGTEDDYGNERDLEKKIRDVSKTLWGYVPGGMQLKKTIQGLEAVGEGGSYDVAGRKQFEVGGTPAKDLQAILFGKYASDESEQYFEKGSGDKELDKLKKIDNKAKAKERERVKEEVDNLRGASKEEVKARLLELAQEDEAFAEKVLDTLVEEKQGLSSTEKKLKNSTVQVRADYIKAQLDDLETNEEKKELLKEYAEKGILTESVLDKIIEAKE